MASEKPIRLETVGKLSKDRDIVQRHIAFLTSKLNELQASPAEDALPRLREIKARLKDLREYLAEISPKLEEAEETLSQSLRSMQDKTQSTLLFEHYVLLRPIREIAQEMGYPLSAVYEWHRKARDAYNAAQGLPPIKDKRGRPCRYDFH